MQLGVVVLAVVAVTGAALDGAGGDADDQNHHHHHHKHNHRHSKSLSSVNTTNVKSAVSAQDAHVVGQSDAKANADSAEQQIVDRMRHLEQKLAVKEVARHDAGAATKGTLQVNGPLPPDFAERFSQAAGRATDSDPKKVKVLETESVEGEPGTVEVVFEGDQAVVQSVEDQAADPVSRLANSPLRMFLVARGSVASGAESEMEASGGSGGAQMPFKSSVGSSGGSGGRAVTPVQDKGIDIDTEMPYGELEAFGREDTAQELTEQSVHESDQMVDQLERAEVAEEKRAVFRALTRLRGAAITSFDGVARSQTGNIDEYNKVHKWRSAHPLHHLADEESDISKWAFPDNADF